MKLNLGCGAEVADGWVNVDYALGARFASIPLFRQLNRRIGVFNQDWNDGILVHDLTTEFPWGESSVDIIYSSHFVEHLVKDDGRRFLEQCHRVLKPSGIIRLVVPDLRAFATEYLEGKIPADQFLEELMVLYGNESGGLKDRLSPFYRYPHKCMYDEARLTQILDEIGFEVVPRAVFDSDIEGIEDIELEERTERAVILEGHKR